MTVTVEDAVRQNQEASEGVAANRSTPSDLDRLVAASGVRVGSQVPRTV